MSINLISTDSPELVNAALGISAEAKSETKEASEASAADAHAGDETESDSETDETEADETAEPKTAEEDKKKGKGGFQKRITKLTSDRDALKNENEALKAQLAGKTAAKPNAEPKSEPAQASQFDKVKPKLENFESLESYTEALSDWKDEERTFKRAQADRAANAQNEAKQLVDTWRSREAEAKSQFEDYDAAIKAVEHIKLTPAHQRVILECEHGPAVAYELAKNPEELKRIASLSPLAAARAIGRIEAKIANAAEAKASTETAPKPETKASSAPRPIKPVNAGSKTSSSTKDPSTMTYREYCAWRDSQR